MISVGFAAAGSWRPGVSFEPAAPTQLSSCLGESWEAVSARKELQIESVSGVIDQLAVYSAGTGRCFVSLIQCYSKTTICYQTVITHIVSCLCNHEHEHKVNDVEDNVINNDSC